MTLLHAPSCFREVFAEPCGERNWTAYTTESGSRPLGSIEERLGSFEVQLDARLGSEHSDRAATLRFSSFEAALSYLNEYAYVLRVFFE